MRTHGHREGSTTHWGLSGVIGEGQQGVGSWGEIAGGEMPYIGEGEEGNKSYYHMCTYATILHVLHMLSLPSSPPPLSLPYSPQ